MNLQYLSMYEGLHINVLFTLKCIFCRVIWFIVFLFVALFILILILYIKIKNIWELLSIQRKFLILKKVAFYYTRGKSESKQKHTSHLSSCHVSLHKYYDLYVLFTMESSWYIHLLLLQLLPHYQIGYSKQC